MVPTTWLGVVFFLVLIAPGLLFDLLAARRRAAPPESAFREAGRIVLASLGFDAFAFIVLVALQQLAPGLLPEPAEILRGGTRFVADNFNQVLGAILGFTVLAVGAVWMVHGVLVMLQGAPTRPESEWTRLFHGVRPEGTLPYVRVRLATGAVYSGLVHSYTADHALPDREIVLAPPLSVQRPDQDHRQDLPDQFARVWIPAQQIVSITVSYHDDPGYREARTRMTGWIQRGRSGSGRGAGDELDDGDQVQAVSRPSEANQQ
ncbi:DUF6338 family protein [Micromonospora sp. DPT]|uniref:DUF6338 family protein n=1 Tax=Micromonospora sp. DPT TaxID=3142975 RepID=UPI00320A7377